MKKQLIFSAALISICSPSFISAESALTFEGSAVLGAYYSSLNPGGGVNFDYTLTAEELSVVDYFYGAEAKISANTGSNSPTLGVEKYSIYVGKNQYLATFSNSLEPDTTPETRIKIGNGLFENWQYLQPVDGASAYSGALSDHSKDGNAAILLASEWGDISAFVGVDERSATEIGFTFDSDYGIFNFSTSPEYGSTPASSAFGASLEIAGATVALAVGQAPSQNKETKGLKITNEFSLTTLTLSAGTDKDGLATGFKQSTGLALDFFIGDQGILTVGHTSLEETAGSQKARSHVSYSHTQGATELIIGFGQDGSDTLLEAGLKFSF